VCRAFGIDENGDEQRAGVIVDECVPREVRFFVFYTNAALTPLAGEDAELKFEYPYARNFAA
jgi:hypothetical protein